MTSMPVRAAKPSASQRRPASRPKSSRIVGRRSCDIWRTLPIASSTRRRQSFSRSRVDGAAGFERGEIGLHRRQRLPQLVVQFVREAARGGLLVLQHVPGDAAQFGRLPLHPADQLRGHPQRNGGEDQRQQHASAGEHRRLRKQSGRAAVDLRLRLRSPCGTPTSSSRATTEMKAS